MSAINLSVHHFNMTTADQDVVSRADCMVAERDTSYSDFIFGTISDFLRKWY